MKVVVIGTGYVGLVSGSCLASLGHELICVDNNIDKINKLKKNIIPIFEPGLEELVKKCVKNKTLSFSTDLKHSLINVDCVLLAVGTPTNPANGRADLKYIYAAARQVAQNLSTDTIIVTKSTVPVGTGKEVHKIVSKERPDLNCQIASNPEFLREGSAIDDFMQPDRIIIGAENQHVKKVMQELYQELIGKGFPILFTNISTAELIKYASNAYLAMKVAFINEIADICEGTGANVTNVVKGMGMDKRIGGKHMKPGPGYGGSCFPKDTLALIQIAKDCGHPTKIIESVVTSNDDRKTNMAQKIINFFESGIKGKNIAVLGLTFKANTDDMRDSPSLVIIPLLLEHQANVKVYDPIGMNEAKKKLTQKQILWSKNSYEACNNADIIVILTEWEEFKNLDYKKIYKNVNQPNIIDLRKIINSELVESIGFKYLTIGKQSYK